MKLLKLKFFETRLSFIIRVFAWVLANDQDISKKSVKQMTLFNLK